MKRVYFVAGLGVLVGSFLGLASCSEENTTTPVGVKDTGAAGDSATTGDEGTTGDTATGGDTPKTETSTGGCPAVLKEGTIKELRDPASAKKVIVNDGVKIAGAVVTSIKWRTQTPNDAMDPCIFSIFIADPNATFSAWSGIQVIAYGDKPVAVDGGRFTCDTDKDKIPNDIKVGDVITVSGTYTEFGATSASCSKATPPLGPPNPEKMPQLRACDVVKTGTGTVPAAATVTPADISQGAPNTQWAGGRVKIGPVTADSDLTFGGFVVKGSTLVVSNDIYYRGAATSPTVKKGDTFDEIVGLSMLDFCTWSLEPNQCSDMKPSAGSAAKCPAATGDGGL